MVVFSFVLDYLKKKLASLFTAGTDWRGDDFYQL